MMAPLDQTQMTLLLKKKGTGLFSTGLVLARGEDAHLVLTKVPQRIVYAGNEDTVRDVTINKPEFDPADRQKALFPLPCCTLMYRTPIQDFDPQGLMTTLYEKEARFLDQLGVVGERHLFFWGIWRHEVVRDQHSFTRSVAAARMFR